MSKWENTTMTQQGQDLLDALIAGSKNMHITKAVVGSGTVAATKLAMQTEVTSPVQEAKLGDTFIVDGAVTIPVIITNTDLSTGYTAKQIGIFAQAEGEEEILVFIAQSDTNGQDIPSKDEPPHGFTAEFHFTIDTGTASDLSITVNSAGLLTTSVADQRYAKKSDIGNVAEEFAEHAANKQNPHGVTAAQIGALTREEAEGLFSNSDHVKDKNNPHGVTAAQIGAQPASTAINTGNIGSQSVNHANTAGDADTVDGWHVKTEPREWGLKPIVATNLDLQANASLTTGYIYLVYD